MRALIALLLFVTGVAQSSTVIWDESVDGDLDATASSRIIIDLQQGVNILRGSHSWTGSSISTFDRESFTLALADGLVVTGINLTTVNTSPGVPFGGFEFVFGTFDQADPLSGGPQDFVRIGAPLDGPVTYTTTDLISGTEFDGLPLPIDAGALDFFTGAGRPAGVAISQDWELSLTVVPLPAAAWLFVSAFGMLAWHRRSSLI